MAKWLQASLPCASLPTIMRAGLSNAKSTNFKSLVPFNLLTENWS